MDPLVDDIHCLRPCGHRLHGDCNLLLRDNCPHHRCPICRRDIQ
jgi:hypothetical protein